MATLEIELPPEVVDEIERRASARGESASRFLSGLVRQAVGPAPEWPQGFFAKVVGGWQGEPLERPEQPHFEVRDGL